MTSAGKPLASVGRPRRFEPQDELRLLFEATLAVMQRNGYADVAVADILAEAGMSTRSFYRHFESKDQLLCALYRHEAEQVAERLTARVARGGQPARGARRLDRGDHEPRLPPAQGGQGGGTRLPRCDAGGRLRGREQARDEAADRAACTRCLPTACATGRSRWQTPRATRRLSSRWYGPRPGSIRSASPPGRARRRSARRSRSAGVRSACRPRHQTASNRAVLGVNPRLPPSAGTRRAAAA